MDHRNREARRSSMVASTNNGLSRRRHRPNSLRDSPDEDGAVEFSESVRLRERVKKDRDRGDRERERERERERSSRSSNRRRGERLMLGSDRGGGDDSSQESNNDDDDDEDDDNNHHHHTNGGVGVRMLPPNPSSTTATTTAAAFPNHHHHHHPLQHRKTFPPSVSRAAAPVWKPGDEMIGVSVPRKARTAHTKRSHDWISSSSGGAVIGGGDQNHRQASTSPARNSVVSTPSPAAPPLSPSSSNASGRKKIKANGSNNKQRPPKTSSKSNPEELEIEIAEVLYGLMTQSQAPPPPCNDSSRQQQVNNNNNNRSRVSSPLSNSQSPPILPTNSNSSTQPFSAIAPKRKRPRQVSENQSSASVRSSPSSAKAEMDQSMTMKAEVSSPPNLEKTTTTPVENGASLIPSDPPVQVPESIKVVDSETKPPQVDEMVGKEEATSPQKESASAIAEDSNRIGIDSTPATTTKPLSLPEVENHREEKIQIDLMAPPPQLRSSPSPEGEGEVNFGFTSAEPKKVVSDSIYMQSASVEAEEKAKAAIVEESDSKKRIVVDGKGRDIDLQLDLVEKNERDNSGCANNKSQHLNQQQQQQPPLKEEQTTEKAILGQSSSLPLPMSMSMASWSGGLLPMGYMAPLQGVVTMDGSAIPPTPLQSIFSQPRPKRCATHCYIARNIHLLQQFMKMNPFWPPPPPPPTASSSASLFGGSKPCNLSVPAAAEFNGRAGPDKGLAIFPGLASGKEKAGSQPPVPDNNTAQRKQQQHILLQQPLPPPVAPNNLLPGHTFIFPINQQQAATAAPRAGAAKSPVASSSNVVSNSGGGNASTTGGAVSFSYPPSMPPNETTTPYLAILQNNAYFPIPAVGAPLNYRGGHGQPLPLFNGSFYSPQMIHHPPPQLQQQQQQQQPTNSQSKQNTSMSSGSSSSHKQHLQNQQKQQQRPPQGNVNGSTGSGNLLHNFPPASKTHSSSQPQNQHIRHIENELGSEDSPSTTAESRGGGSRPPINVYNQSYVMQIHPSNFGVMAPPPSTSGNQSEKKPALKTGGGGLESSMPPQPFAMSFASISGASSTPGIDISSSMGQSHAIFQSLPEATRQNLHIVAAAAQAQAQAQAAQHKKCYRDDTRSGSGDPTDDERKKVPATTSLAGGGQQSIAFSRPDLTDGSKGAPNNNVIDSSRSISLAAASGGPTAWTARAVVPNSMGTVVSNAQLHAQLQQQMVVQQLHKQQQQQHQQQQLAATAVSRSSKAAPPPTSNGIVYSEQHLTSSGGAKFSNAFPQNLVQTSNNNNSPSQSPQWKASSAKNCAAPQAQSSSLASATSSLKNLTQQQQQQLRTQQNHTHISFSANQKSTPSQGQQHHHAPSNNNQSQSMAGSPTTSSISKGAGGSPRTATTSASMSSKTDPTPSQQGKASMSSIPNQKSSPASGSGRNVPSILGNQHNASSGSKTQMQQQLSKGAHQSQLFFSGSYAQPQPQPTSTSSASAATSGYYIQRRRPEQQQPPPSSSGMLTLCPVTLGDPAKAIAAAAASSNSNMRGGSFPSQTILHATQFTSQSSGNQHHILPAGFPYVHVPAAVQVKPTEQKQQQQQPAGNDNLQACWQPEKK